jgi:serine/threonine protein phosphatase PrpC
MLTVSDYNGEPMGPLRVWLKNEDAPGLAMTRSMGDGVGQRVGVSPEPEVTIFDLKEEHKFVLIASDGVWEFLSNEDVADIVSPYVAKNAPEAAANALVKESLKKWKEVRKLTIFLGRRSD